MGRIHPPPISSRRSPRFPVWPMKPHRSRRSSHLSTPASMKRAVCCGRAGGRQRPPATGAAKGWHWRKSGCGPPTRPTRCARRCSIPTLDPARREPAVAFAKARGMLPLPVEGRPLLRLRRHARGGHHTAHSQSECRALATAPGALVRAPADGRVVYAGPVPVVRARSYFGRGRFLPYRPERPWTCRRGGAILRRRRTACRRDGRAAARRASVIAQNAAPLGLNAPVLYVEFRKGGRPSIRPPGGPNVRCVRRNSIRVSGDEQNEERAGCRSRRQGRIRADVTQIFNVVGRRRIRCREPGRGADRRPFLFQGGRGRFRDIPAARYLRRYFRAGAFAICRGTCRNPS